MMDNVISIIADIQRAKEQKNKEPAYALLSEIACQCHGDPRPQLNQLYLGGKIQCHRTINQLAFYIKR